MLSTTQIRIAAFLFMTLFLGLFSTEKLVAVNGNIPPDELNSYYHDHQPSFPRYYPHPRYGYPCKSCNKYCCPPYPYFYGHYGPPSYDYNDPYYFDEEGIPLVGGHF
jgi:hypothetical protein